MTTIRVLASRVVMASLDQTQTGRFLPALTPRFKSPPLSRRTSAAVHHTMRGRTRRRTEPDTYTRDAFIMI